MDNFPNTQDETIFGGHIHTAELSLSLCSGAGRISCACVSHQGKRDVQEDSCGISEIPDDGRAERFTAVVADGMGGLPAGAGASGHAVRELLAADFGAAGGSITERLCGAFRNVSAQIAANGSGGGTTLAALVCVPEGVYYCSAGDSRIYLQRNGVLTQLTEDGDHFGELLDKVAAGTMTYEQAAADPEKDSLSQYIGSGAYIQPDCSLIPFQPQEGDRIMLCSDGVYNALSGDELMQSLCLSARGAAEDILGRILARGYSNQDNFTAVVIEFRAGEICGEERSFGDNTEALTAEVSCCSAVGGCAENQDSVYSSEGIYAVADGLGGISGGAQASARAIRSLTELADRSIPPEQINGLLERLNTDVRSLGGGMSTIAAGFFGGGSFRWGSVGDSRVYYFRRGSVIMQSHDDSVCGNAVDSGRLNAEQIRSSSERNGLLKALGGEERLNLDRRCEPIEVQEGDAFLICSDGFWEYVHEREMEADLLKSSSSREWLRHMVRRLLLRSHDSGDNYSAVCGIFTAAPEQGGNTEKRRRLMRWLIPAICAVVVILLAYFLFK